MSCCSHLRHWSLPKVRPSTSLIPSSEKNFLFRRRSSNHELQHTGPADQTQKPPKFRGHETQRPSTEPSQPDKPQNEHEKEIEPKVVGDEGEANVRDNYYYYRYYYY
jgi:hypothetical protein